jgi:excisionase family DNA binding protein
MPVTNETSRPELLTATEVATMLRVSRRTVRHLTDANELPFVQVTRGIRRFRRSDVEVFLSERLSAQAQ